MTCAHCTREVAGAAVIFRGKPPVCGRADCLAWARALIVEVPRGDADFATPRFGDVPAAA